MKSPTRNPWVLWAIGGNFGVGLLLVVGILGWQNDTTYLITFASIVASVLWAAFYIWASKRFQSAFLPILLFPNPFIILMGFVLVFGLICFNGGGCL